MLTNASTFVKTATTKKNTDREKLQQKSLILTEFYGAKLEIPVQSSILRKHRPRSLEKLKWIRGTTHKTTLTDKAS